MTQVDTAPTSVKPDSNRTDGGKEKHRHTEDSEWEESKVFSIRALPLTAQSPQCC